MRENYSRKRKCLTTKKNKMNASVNGLLNYLKRNPRKKSCLEHNGKELNRIQSIKILEYCIEKKYKNTSEITHIEIDNIIKNV